MKKMLTFLIATILILAMSLMPLQAITGINSLVMVKVMKLKVAVMGKMLI